MEIRRIQVGNGNCYLIINGKDAVLVDTAIGKTTAAQLDAGPSDVYVVDKDFRWTYVHTHEDGCCGPYFCKLG